MQNSHRTAKKSLRSRSPGSIRTSSFCGVFPNFSHLPDFALAMVSQVTPLFWKSWPENRTRGQSAALPGQLLFSDVNYIRQTKELIDSQRTYIVESLTSMDGIKVYPPHANFILVRLTNGLTAHQLFETAIRQGLMIRDCSDFPFLDDTYFRFCFMMPSDNDRLLACIRKFLHL